MTKDPPQWRKKHPVSADGLSDHDVRMQVRLAAKKESIDYKLRIDTRGKHLVEDEVGFTMSGFKKRRRSEENGEDAESDELSDEFHALHEEQSHDHPLMEDRRGEKFVWLWEKPRIRHFSGEETQGAVGDGHLPQCGQARRSASPLGDHHNRQPSGGNRLRVAPPSEPPRRRPRLGTQGNRVVDGAASSCGDDVAQGKSVPDGLQWLRQRDALEGDVKALESELSGDSGIVSNIRNVQDTMQTHNADQSSLLIQPDQLLQAATQLHDDVKKAMDSTSKSQKGTYDQEVEKYRALKARMDDIRPQHVDLLASSKFLLDKARTAKRSQYMTTYGQSQRLQKELQSGGFGHNHAKQLAKAINTVERAMEDGVVSIWPQGVVANPKADTFNMNGANVWAADDEFAQEIGKRLSDSDLVSAKCDSIQQRCDDNPAWPGALGQIDGFSLHDVATKRVPEVDRTEGSDAWIFGSRRSCKRDAPSACPLPAPLGN